MKFKKFLLPILTLSIALTFIGCSQKNNSDKVVIYSNADEEPINIIKETLDNTEMKNKYVIQSFGTSELGGKLLAEGKNIEADMITMSSFYIDSAQEENSMFMEFDPNIKTINDTPKYRYPLITPEGAIFYNTNALKEKNLPVPKSFKDLAKPIYKDQISLSDVNHSSTAWLTIQALIDSYGESEAKNILSDIYKNAGDHLESSGSAPLKKVRVGEVPIGIGLRHQAIIDKEKGDPINYVDPEEGTYELVESVAIINKDDKTKAEDAKKIANIILKDARKKIMDLYPTELYEGESAKEDYKAKNKKVYPESLTIDLLKEHQSLSEEAK